MSSRSIGKAQTSDDETITCCSSQIKYELSCGWSQSDAELARVSGRTPETRLGVPRLISMGSMEWGLFGMFRPK